MSISLPPYPAPPDLTWADLEPIYRDLDQRHLDVATVDRFLVDWNAIFEVGREAEMRLRIATTQNTGDTEAAERYRAFVSDVGSNVQEAEQRIKRRFLASGLAPRGFEEPLRKLRMEADLFREENVALLSQEKKLQQEYSRIVGIQTVEWEGQDIPVPRLFPVYQDPRREVRERAWHVITQRQLADRDGINDVWRRSLELRRELAANCDLPDYRTYRWQQLCRFDYTPDDAKRFHDAIEAVVVPALLRAAERRREQLGIATLRPWDLQVDPLGNEPLRPFDDATELEKRGSTIFHHVDPQLGAYFDSMRRDELLDLSSRRHKVPGGYNAILSATRKPFIFMNAVGTPVDVTTLMHESGHAFHVFETRHLPYLLQRVPGNEFTEVASIAMEYLTDPYLAESDGGFYSARDAARARIKHLEMAFDLWTAVAATDAFQHWVYEHPEDAADPAHLDDAWAGCQRRFRPHVDWSGHEDALRAGWQMMAAVLVLPFYMIDYAMALLAAVQIWGNARTDQADAVRRYRAGLALGATVPLPDLYRAAGADFVFDVETLGRAVSLIEETIDEVHKAV